MSNMEETTRPTAGGRSSPAMSVPKINSGTGFSKREYAAILLKVPNSGVDWLDDMIRESNQT